MDSWIDRGPPIWYREVKPPAEAEFKLLPSIEVATPNVVLVLYALLGFPKFG